MGLPALPITDSFRLVWRHDTALDHKREDFENAYRVAIETLDWEPLLIPGEQPTYFHFRLVDQDTMRRLADSPIGPHQTLALVFRLALCRIENAPGCPEFKRKRDVEFGKLGEMAEPSVVDYLDRACVAYSLATKEEKGSVVLELAGFVAARCSGVSPK